MHVLLVDDDLAVLGAYQRVLETRGWTVDTATNGRRAIERVQSISYDVIVSDIGMPEMTGVEFLRAVREYDLDVPVILMTGAAALESAIRAVEYGVFQYLVKPVDSTKLRELVGRAGQLHQLAKLKRSALELDPNPKRLGDRASLDIRFSWGLSLMWMAFQPIVEWRTKRIHGFEALLRSDEPLMKNPSDMLDAAERLGRLHDLGRAVRKRVAEAAPKAPESAKLFVNLHAADLNDDDLYSANAPLSKIANRVVLEMTERASLDGVKDVEQRIARLRALGYSIAIDDLGTGYAGLTSFTRLEPNVAKLDMSLVRGIDSDPRRQAIVESMKKLCNDLGVLVVAEGVETVAERDTLVALGCDLLQGYLFARPDRLFRDPTW